MPTYTFECAAHAAFDLRLAMSEDTASASCPQCGAAARRRYHAPTLRSGNDSARRLLDATQRSAHEPALVTAPPPRRAHRRPTTTDPRTAKLPRP